MNRGIYWKGSIAASEAIPFYVRHFLYTRQVNAEKMDLHAHHEVEFYINLTGEVTFLSKNQVYHLSRGDVCFTRPDELHHCVYHDTIPHEHFGVMFIGDNCTDAISFLYDDRKSSCFFPTAADKEELIEICFALLKHNLPESERQYLFLRMLHLLKRSAREPLKTPDKLPKDMVSMLAFVEQHLDVTVTVAEMAKALYISQSSIERRFKEFLHMTPLAYIHKRKLQTASTMLRGGSTVSAAAAAVGFADTSYFIRLFERNYGMTPHRYKSLINQSLASAESIPDNLYPPSPMPK